MTLKLGLETRFRTLEMGLVDRSIDCRAKGRDRSVDAIDPLFAQETAHLRRVFSLVVAPQAAPKLRPTNLPVPIWAPCFR